MAKTKTTKSSTVKKSSTKSTASTKTKAAKSPKKTAAKPKKGAPATYDQIAALAYEIWEKEGYPNGREVEHWVAAEQELNGGK